MNKYLVVAIVAGKNYLVNVEATSNYKAEHEILDRGVCGRHSYGVEGAQAFGKDELNSDTFKWMALNSKTVSMTELMEIINANNSNIILRDYEEKVIEESEKKIEELQRTIETARETIERIDSISGVE